MISTNLLRFVSTLCICSSVLGQDPELVERAEGGDAFWQNVLGLMYRNGFDVPENDTEAVKWYRLAADQGNASAQFNLGVILLIYGGLSANVVVYSECRSKVDKKRKFGRTVVRHFDCPTA